MAKTGELSGVSAETVRPLGDRVLVRRDPEERVTAGGLALPDRSTNIPRRGTVLRLGRGRKSIDCPQCGGCGYDKTGLHGAPGLYCEECRGKTVTTLPFQVQVGDTVYFNKFGGIEVEADGETLLLMSEEEILAFTRE